MHLIQILDCPEMIDEEIKGNDSIFNADRIFEILKVKKIVFITLFV